MALLVFAKELQVIDVSVLLPAQLRSQKMRSGNETTCILQRVGGAHESYLRTFRSVSVRTTNSKDGGRTRHLRTNSGEM